MNICNIIQKVLVNVSSDHAYLMCLCILGTLSSLRAPPSFLAVVLRFLLLFVDCVIVHSVEGDCPCVIVHSVVGDCPWCGC